MKEIFLAMALGEVRFFILTIISGLAGKAFLRSYKFRIGVKEKLLAQVWDL